MSYSIDEIYWAATECAWQHSGPLSVVWMLEGLSYVRLPAFKLDKKHLTALARIVEPRHNDGRRYRDMRVWVGAEEKMAPDEIEGAMARHLATPGDDPDVWFYTYENIHPFRDGNGRTGSILWNYLRGTLDAPEEPPDCWNARNSDPPGSPEARPGWR